MRYLLILLFLIIFICLIKGKIMKDMAVPADPAFMYMNVMSSLHVKIPLLFIDDLT